MPKCRANYREEYTPVFSFPREDDRRQIWLKRIPRENLKITKHCGVCIKHFPEEQISRVIKLTRPDGKLKVGLATVHNLKCYVVVCGTRDSVILIH